MDFQIPLVFGGIFVIASLVLVFVYKFGIKEKSYEEALAEQRQHAQTLLGVNPNNKPSSKDKKNKKAAKKGKDKPSSSEDGIDSGTSDGSTRKLSLAKDNSKVHVEFKEGADEIIIKEEIKIPNTIKKKTKKDKVKSILIKDTTKENLVNADKEASPANHFEESHPKDEFELMRSASIMSEKTDDPPQQNTNHSNSNNNNNNNNHSKKETKASKNKQPSPAAAENPPSAGTKNESGGSKPKEKDTSSSSSSNSSNSSSKESSGKNKNEDKKKAEPPALSGVQSNKNSEIGGKSDDSNGGNNNNKSKSQSKKQLKAQQQQSEQISSVSSQSQQQQQQAQVRDKPLQSQEVVEEKSVEISSAHQVTAAAPSVGVAVNNGPAAMATINTGKDKKKKKSEFNTLQQIAGDKNGPNISTLLNLVRKAELSRSEVQILTDLLLNKQHEAPEIVDEWSEGKSDPVQKLKRQLADKEKLLVEEQEALTGAQAKLREIRAEQQAERSQLQQKIRGYEEALQSKQAELRGLVQQVQQLQAQVKDEAMKNHKLCEEHAAFQMQRQQLEMRIAQAQEAEVANQELAAVNQQLRVELSRISEENVNGEERHQAMLVQMNNFQNELEQKTEYIRQLEEARLSFEHNLEQALRQENDFKIEISRLNSAYQQQVEELRRTEHGKKQLQDEIYRLQKQIEESEAALNQYKNDLQTLEEENTALRNAQQQLQEESSNSSAQDSINQQKEEEMNKEREIQLLNLSNELSSVKTALQQTEIKYVEELKQRVAAETQLREELDEQKEKNNALRTRNWKVMEALNAAESKLKSGGSDSQHNSDVKSKSDLELQHIQFVQRLYPEIKELETIPVENFQLESQRLITEYVENLRQRATEERQQKEDVQSSQQHQQVIKELEAQLIHYKGTIDSTEKMLSNLQRHIEQEEINWRLQLAAKTAEVEAIKEQSAQLNARLSSLEKELQEQHEEKNRISRELEEQKSRTTSDVDNSTTIKTLSEEVTRLKEQLHQQEQQTKNGDIEVSPKAQNCTSATNGATPLIQYCVSSSSSIASSLSEVSIRKSKIKKKRKKGNGN